MKIIYRLMLVSCVILLAPPLWAQVGAQIPAFSLQDLDGKTYTEKDYEGRILVLYFMGYN